MTIAEARAIAQSDPVPNLTANWGTLAAKARHRVDELNSLLRELDKTTAALAEKGMVVSVDLGPVGNAAAAARRDLEKQKPHTFELPKAS